MRVHVKGHKKKRPNTGGTPVFERYLLWHGSGKKGWIFPILPVVIKKSTQTAGHLPQFGCVNGDRVTNWAEGVILYPWLALEGGQPY